MKKILVSLFVCFSTLSKAQSNLCPALQAFNGEWRYVNGQDTIRIYLRYHECYFNSENGSNTSTLQGQIFGWHEYKIGNTIVESDYANRYMTLPTIFDNLSPSTYSILLVMPYCDVSRHRIRGGIYDLSQCRERKSVTVIFNSAQNLLSWEQIHPTGFGFKTGCKGMTLPSNFVLSKQ